MLPRKTSSSKGSAACYGGSSPNYGDRDFGCFLQFFEVVMADLTGRAAAWNTFTVGAIGLRQIAAFAI
jgi:hypothetical protein